MNFLKSLGISIFSFILFLSLTVFSIAFMFHGTILNSDFILAQVDKMPISDIARDVSDEFIGEQLSEEMPFVKDVALNVLEKQEPWVKEEIKAAAITVHDYFLGETDELYIVIPLAELKQNLQDTLWDEAKLYLKEQTAGMSDTETSRYLQDIIRDIPEDILPPELFVYPTNQRNQYIEQYLRDFAGLRPLAGVPPLDPSLESLAEQYFNQFLEDFIDEVPDTYTIDESSLGSQTMDGLSTARKVIGYFQTYYYWVIVLMIVLVALIFLLSMNIRATARALGTNLFIFGVLDLIGVILMKSLPIMDLASEIMKQEIPASLTTWIDGLISDVSSVALPLSIGILVAGVVLLVVSFVIPRKEVEA